MYRSDGMMNWVEKKAFVRHHKHEVINAKNIEDETERAESVEENLLAKIAELESEIEELKNNSFNLFTLSFAGYNEITEETPTGMYYVGQGRAPVLVFNENNNYVCYWSNGQSSMSGGTISCTEIKNL